MIIACIYLLLFLWLIVYNGFFGLFKDEVIPKKQFAGLFLLKAAAIPVFYIVYQKLYGGIEKFDSGKFYNDVRVISGVAKSDLLLYLKLLLGLQSDAKTSYDFLMVMDTVNWDNGVMKDYLYNDNRVLIRIHSLFHFIAFDSYFVHALFSCFLSFIGITCLYRTFREFFIAKETGVLVILCFFPALWFYTGALLKEGLMVFILGASLYQLKQLTDGTYSPKGAAWLLFLLFLSCLLKPYVLFFAFICFSCFFMIHRKSGIRYRIVLFCSLMFVLALIVNTLSLVVKHKSLYEAALRHQRIFSGVAKGGVFLYNRQVFIRIEYDPSSVKKIAGSADRYTIRKDVPYMYWKDGRSQDTLYCAANKDTLSAYHLAYMIPVSNSNITPAASGNAAVTLLSCLYYTLCYPFFFNAKSAILLLASLENLIILISLGLCCYGFARSKKERFLPFIFLFFALAICLLIGITAPNSGAIFRYRSPAVVFILLSALYYSEWFKSKTTGRT